LPAKTYNFETTYLPSPRQHPRSISNYYEIGTEPLLGNMTYKAGKTINLKPGFKVEKGAYFHGIISNIPCSLNSFYSYNSPISTEYWDFGSTIDSNADETELSVRTDSYIIADNNVSLIDSISIYPNPFNDCIKLFGFVNNKTEYMLFTTSGILIKHGLCEDLICFEELYNGLFILKLINNSEITIYKLIKE
jgi:hypothetical protein